jgi:hypothetical protein
MDAAETAGIDRLGHVPSVVVSLGCAVPNDAGVFACLARRLSELDRMNL